MSSKYLKPTPSDPSLKFDWIGFSMVTAGVGSILYVLGQGREFESALTWTNLLLVIIGFILIVLFVRFELRQKQPLLDLTVFRIKRTDTQ